MLSDQPVTGTRNMTFAIYTVETGGTDAWTETQNNVPIADGLFNVLLGSVNPIQPSVFDGENRWLGVTIVGDPEIAPRHRLVSVGYAMTANNLEGVVTVDTPTGNVGIGTTSPGAKLDVDGDVKIGYGNKYNVGAYGGLWWNSGSGSVAIGDSMGPRELGLYSNSSTPRMWIDDTGNVGIGTTGPLGRLHLKGAGTTTGFTFRTQDSAGTDRFVIQDNGNVGIGTTSPINPLNRITKKMQKE